MYLYINNLRELPNFGCRTTGNALELLLKTKNSVEQYDATESAASQGAWSYYAKLPLKDGGIVPRSIYNKLFHIRHDIPNIFRIVQKIDKVFGGTHDYITNDPIQSIENYTRFLKKHPQLSSLKKKMTQSEGVVINGEGTLIFGNPTQRDALYLLFVLALAKELDKPVYLLNAMITPCPYSGEDPELLSKAAPLLKYCKVIAVRESKSYEYVAQLSGKSNLRIIPDALFSWGPKIRRLVKFVRDEPDLCIAHPDNSKRDNLVFDEPYLCISGSSSAWRYNNKIRTQFVKLIKSLNQIGKKIIVVETCDGDRFLEQVAKECNVTFLPKTTPIMAAMGVLAGSQLYITGRYHPAIMASANGVPCIFLTSNSHKTSSIQQLLGYTTIKEHPICPTDEEILDILGDVKKALDNRNAIHQSILENFEKRREQSNSYLEILDTTS